MEQSMAASAVGCGLVGAVVGLGTGSSGLGAAAGAGCMAIAVVTVYNYHTSQVRTAQQDQRLYGYTAPVNSTEVKIRNAQASPETVRPGSPVKLTLDYSVMAPNGTQSVDVTETMTLKHDGKVVQVLNDKPINRQLGGSSTSFDFTVPDKMPAGTYVIEQKVSAGTSYDIRPTVFVVGS
jgi:hypothetical protein